MTSVMSFEDRSKAFETKFAMDQEVLFKINCKTNLLVAEWAADRLELDPEASRAFVNSLTSLALESGAPQTFKQRILANFKANEIDLTENALDRLITLKSEIAKKQVLKEQMH